MGLAHIWPKQLFGNGNLVIGYLVPLLYTATVSLRPLHNFPVPIFGLIRTISVTKGV